MKKTIVAVAVILIAGCATPEQQWASAVQSYGPVCEARGFVRDTPSWQSCVSQSEYIARQERAAGLAVLGGAMSNAGRAMTPTITQCATYPGGMLCGTR